MTNSVTYYVRMCRVHHFSIENIDFVSDTFGVNQDGLHIGGDVRHGTVRNIRALSYGQTNDDMIALNADDSIERVENFDLCRDTIEDISFENIFTECCHTIIRMLSVTAEIKNIRFKNIFGGFRCNAINADAARYSRREPNSHGFARQISASVADKMLAISYIASHFLFASAKYLLAQNCAAPSGAEFFDGFCQSELKQDTHLARRDLAKDAKNSRRRAQPHESRVK